MITNSLQILVKKLISIIGFFAKQCSIEKSPTKSSFKWLFLIMGKGECRHSTWVSAGTICINDLPNGLQSNSKLFADNTSLLSAIHDITTSTIILNHDNLEISGWTVQWEINFNSDPCKQAQELQFSQKDPSNTHHCILMKISFIKFNPRALRFVFRFKVKF